MSVRTKWEKKKTKKADSHINLHFLLLLIAGEVNIPSEQTSIGRTLELDIKYVLSLNL